MTPDEIRIGLALRCVTFVPGTSVKRFAQSMAWKAENRPESPLTEKQSRYLKQLAWRYRRQLPESIVRLGLKPEPKAAQQ